MTTSKQIVQPLGWPRPSGYAHGVAANGRLLFIAGQVGWNLRAAKPKLGKTFKDQFEQALGNVLDVVREAGGRPEDVVRLLVYVVSKTEYQQALKPLGAIWKRRMGRHYPAISVVRVAGLLDPGAKVEIEGVAVLDEPKRGRPLSPRPGSAKGRRSA